jgi:hypothetical protein
MAKGSSAHVLLPCLLLFSTEAPRVVLSELAGVRLSTCPSPACVRFFRQASEQYSTASQLRAHARRQVIVRPQTAQGLEGREDLLPFQREGVLE